MEAMNSWGAPANVATAGAIEAKAIDASKTIAKADIAKRKGALCSLFVACVGVSYGFGFMLNQHALGFQSGNDLHSSSRRSRVTITKRLIGDFDAMLCYLWFPARHTNVYTTGSALLSASIRNDFLQIEA